MAVHGFFGPDDFVLETGEERFGLGVVYGDAYPVTGFLRKVHPHHLDQVYYNVSVVKVCGSKSRSISSQAYPTRRDRGPVNGLGFYSDFRESHFFHLFR